MTLKQGEDINNQFTILKDSLLQLNETTLMLRKQMSSMGVRNIQLSTNLSKSKDEIGVLNTTVDLYKLKYEESKNEIRFLKRDHRNVVTGLLGIIVIWTVYTSALLNK